MSVMAARAGEASLTSWPGYNLNDLLGLLRFVPTHADRQTLYPINEPINRLDVLVEDNWLKANEPDLPATTTKQSYLAYLRALTPANLTDISKCTSISLDGSRLCDASKARPQYITSADGALKGIAYLWMQHQSVSYDPQAVVEMTGTVAGKTVYVRGNFSLYDTQYETLGGQGIKNQSSASNYTTKVIAARDAYTAGNVSADTLQLYQEVIDTAKSLKFSEASK